MRPISIRILSNQIFIKKTKKLEKKKPFLSNDNLYLTKEKEQDNDQFLVDHLEMLYLYKLNHHE